MYILNLKQNYISDNYFLQGLIAKKSSVPAVKTPKQDTAQFRKFLAGFNRRGLINGIQSFATKFSRRTQK